MIDTISIALVVITDRLGSENAAYSAVQDFIDVYDDKIDNTTIIGLATVEIDRYSVNKLSAQRKSTTGILSKIVDYYQFKIVYMLYKKLLD